MKQDLKKMFLTVLGSEQIFSDIKSVEKYSADVSGGATRPIENLIVIFPTSTQQVSSCLMLAYENNISVFPRGRGTGLSGGCVPTQDGVVMSLEQMDQIYELDNLNNLLVESGTIVESINNFVDNRGLFYPPSPNSASISSIGGNFLHDASGPRSFKYGSTKESVVGARICLMDGRVLDTGFHRGKHSSGFDLLSLLGGSEGVLGVVTELTLKLLEKPSFRVSAVISFSHDHDAVAFTDEIMQVNVKPSAFDFVSKVCTQYILSDFDSDFEGKALLLLEFDTIADFEYFVVKCQDLEVTYQIIFDKVRQLSIWTMRAKILPMLKNMFPDIYVIDLSVPLEKMSEFLSQIEQWLDAAKIDWSMIGNIGQGNLHIGLHYPNSVEFDLFNSLVDNILMKSISYGGSVCFEHGIGLKKRKLFKEHINKDLYKTYIDLKSVFDSKGLLNPGKFV